MRRAWRSGLGVEWVTVDEIGPALLVHAEGDSATALAALTGSLPREPGRVAIVSTPSVTARPDYLHVIGQIVETWTWGDDVGVRLVAMGRAAALSAVEPQLRALSDVVGREVVAPLGSLTVGTDGTVAAAAPGYAGGGWVTYTPGEPPRYEPAWFPLPAWAKDLPPETAGVSACGAAATYPVPAGYWILPRGVTPERAGSASGVAPDPTVATVFLGGFGELPLALDDIVLSLAALPMTARYRLALLPGALRGREDAERLREFCDPSVRIVAAVPLLSGDSARSLAFVGAGGGLTTLLPGSEDRADLRPAPRTLLGPPDGQDRLPALPERQAPGRPAPGLLRPGMRTAAGWSFVAGSEPVGMVPTPAGFVVEADMDVDGFRLNGRSVTAGKVADLIAAVCPPDCRTVVVIAHGTPPAGHVADSVFGALASVLGRAVVAADSDVSMSRSGLLHTSGLFRSWRVPPPEPGDGPHVRGSSTLGDTLPPLPTMAPPAPGRSALTTRPAPQKPVDAARPATATATAQRTMATSVGPRWITASSCDVQDRLRLRQLLDGKYETHARILVRQPFRDQESSDARPSAATVTGLVALRAYCASERDAVNGELRGTGPVNAGVRSTLLAECAMYGLRQLPVVSGPVFATCPISVPASAYEVGVEFAEPAFIDIGLSPNDEPGDGIDYHIWSLSARNVGSVAPGGRSVAMFAAGSRFRVVGVEAGPDRPRVLLLDLAVSGGSGEGTTLPGVQPAVEDIREALHHSRLAASAGSGPGPRPLAFPVGLLDWGQQHQRPDGPGSATAQI